MADDKPDPTDPSNVTQAWSTMQPKWKLVQTLMDGTAAMREAGRDYLPQHDSESNPAYSERLESCTLYNVFKLTVNALVGRPFGTQVDWVDTTPPEISDLFTNIDLQGTDLHGFTREWFREGLTKGFCHILIDSPGGQPDERAQRTKLDDMNGNMRPFWKLISPENVLAAFSEVIGGVERLTHVRILETEIVREGFLEVSKRFIRVLEPGTWALYEEIIDKTSKKVIWRPYDSGITDIDFIPLQTFYAGQRSGLNLCTPPLEDLGYLNVRHWQSTSDQQNVLTVARFPILAVAGSHEINADTMAIGPRQLLGTRDSAGRFYYVEHTGKAIEAGDTDLANLEEIMGNYGAEFLKKKKVASRNPQDRIYDVTESTSELQEMILRFQATVGNALAMTAVWLKLPLKDGKPYGGDVLIDNDFTIQDSNANDLQHLAQARVNEDISLPTYIDTLKRLNVLDDNIDTTEEVQRVANERGGELVGEDGAKIKMPPRQSVVQPALPPRGVKKGPAGTDPASPPDAGNGTGG